jgi:nucleotide-binding universal stress UspA family protein
MYRRIVLAYDGSLDGQEALRQAMDLARLCDAEVSLLAVVDPSKDLFTSEAASIAIAQEEQSISTILQAGLAQLKRRRLKAQAEIKFGNPAKEISKFACEFRADLIVVGHREQNPWMRWWNGSVGASVLIHAPCSLLVAVDRHVPPEPCEVESFERHARKRRSFRSRTSDRPGGDAA